MNIVQQIEQEQINELGKDIPDFKSGDTLKIHLWIIERDGKKRIQIFEGICLGKKNRGINSSFTVRKISSGGIGVEKTFSLYSPTISVIEVVRKGDVRRAKIYYLSNLKGKAARIKEKRDFKKN